MKKAISVFLSALMMLMIISAVSASRFEDKDEPMKAEGCAVYKWINPFFNRVFVFKSFKNPKSCYVVIDITSNKIYGEGLQIARNIMPAKAMPETIGKGTEFNIAKFP